MKHNQVKIVEVNTEREGQRIDNYLFSQYKKVPKGRIYRAIRKGEVRINKKRCKAETKLVAGDKVRIPPLHTVATSDASGSKALQEYLLTQILYEDDSLLVINKPAGLPVHGGSGVNSGLIEALRAAREHSASYELVHRLDKGTSGCLLVAKKRSALRALHQQIQQHQIKKIYWCLSMGNWQPKHQKVSQPLKKNTLASGERMVRIDRENGKPSSTTFNIIRHGEHASLIEARLHTGRTHQIRVHLQYLKHPIAGDDKYGNMVFNQKMKQLGLHRMFLHAHSLKFTLPNQEKNITVTAPLQDELTECLTKLVLI